jgi:hypothetical protein
MRDEVEYMAMEEDRELGIAYEKVEAIARMPHGRMTARMAFALELLSHPVIVECATREGGCDYDVMAEQAVMAADALLRQLAE